MHHAWMHHVGFDAENQADQILAFFNLIVRLPADSTLDDVAVGERGC